MQRFANKSFVTNFIAFSVIVLSYLFEAEGVEVIKTMGMYALSGSLTNWIAVHMLFEKVPGLYGSGIIPNKFEEFKLAIKSLMMEQFFTKHQLEQFFKKDSDGFFNPENLVKNLDYDLIYSKLLDAIKQSPAGALLGMLSGPQGEDSLKSMFVPKIKDALTAMLDDPTFSTNMKESISGSFESSDLVKRVEEIIDARLSELTPQMVKEMVQEMIRSHLGWLVVWGGVFGGLIGLLAATLTSVRSI